MTRAASFLTLMLILAAALPGLVQAQSYPVRPIRIMVAYTPAGTTDLFLSHSDDRGSSWTTPIAVADQLSTLVDRFNHWLAVDPVTGDVNVSFYDTRNDTTGSRYMTDTYFTQSRDGGATWLANVRVTETSSNEHDCGGLFPCPGIDYGNQ